MVSPLIQSIPTVSAVKSGIRALPSPGTLFQNPQQLSFNSSIQQPPFASIVQTPITKIAQDRIKQQEDSAEAKRKKEAFTLVGPSLLLLGGLSWLLKGKNPAFSKIGSAALGAGGAFLGVNGILAGITSSQPSMIIGNILQFIPSALLLFLTVASKNSKIAAKGDILRNIAMSANMATGAMFTVGFANEIRNKDVKTTDAQKRGYDMTRFKAITDSKTNIPFFNRVNGITAELGKMLGFTITDHARLLKHIPEDLKQITSIFKTHPSEHPSDNALKNWFTKPSADKSELAALLFYLGALPVLMFSHKIPHLTNTQAFKSASKRLPNAIQTSSAFKWATKPVEKIAESKSLISLKWLGMLFANLSLFSIAWNRSDLRGKAPLLGVPLAVFGMASSNQFRQGMGNVGESINNLLFSDIAVNGLDTNLQKSGDAPKTISTNAQSLNQPVTNPFQSIRLTKQPQIS